MARVEEKSYSPQKVWKKSAVQSPQKLPPPPNKNAPKVEVQRLENAIRRTNFYCGPTGVEPKSCGPTGVV